MEWRKWLFGERKRIEGDFKSASGARHHYKVEWQLGLIPVLGFLLLVALIWKLLGR